MSPKNRPLLASSSRSCSIKCSVPWTCPDCHALLSVKSRQLFLCEKAPIVEARRSRKAAQIMFPQLFGTSILRLSDQTHQTPLLQIADIQAASHDQGSAQAVQSWRTSQPLMTARLLAGQLGLQANCLITLKHFTLSMRIYLTVLVQYPLSKHIF